MQRQPLRLGRPPKGTPASHRAWGSMALHNGWLRNCRVCSNAYINYWKRKRRQSLHAHEDRNALAP